MILPYRGNEIGPDGNPTKESKDGLCFPKECPTEFEPPPGNVPGTNGKGLDFE